MYHRPTIPWKLECELNSNFTRADAINYFKQRFYLVQQISKYVGSFCIPALVFVIVVPCRGSLEILGGKARNSAGAIMIMFALGFIIAGCFIAKPTMIAWRAWQK